MKKQFVMRGKTASGLTEILNFSGFKKGYAYRMTEFQIYPSTAIGTQAAELAATVTAAKTYEDPSNPNFTHEGLIATATLILAADHPRITVSSVVNDTFLITQDLIIAVIDAVAGSPMDVNWQCRFVSEKMNLSQEAVANYNQFTIFDG